MQTQMTLPAGLADWNLEQASALIHQAHFASQMKPDSEVSADDWKDYVEDLRHSAGMHIANANAVRAAGRIQIGPLDI